jgi:hypothetical protein
MAALAALERLLERIFERSTARLFRTHIQVVQLERRVERAMERARLADGGRTVVPSRYRVRMHPADIAATADGIGGAEALAGRLADAALAFARAHVYHLADRPVVILVADPTMGAGQVDVLVAGDTGTAAIDARPAGPHGRPGPAAHRDDPVPEVMTPGIRGGSQTQVFRRPVPQAARAVLRTLTADGGERTIEVDGTPLAIGRAGDNGLVLDDGRVSRHHGRLQARRGALVYTDLGSTNGSRVNGVRVDEIVLGQGDRLEVGGTVLVVETLPG